MSQHWYGRDGQPCYTVIGANGKERDTTLRDARKHGYVPSVTTIIGQLSKPGLEVWKQNKLIEACWDSDQNGCFDDFKYWALVSYKEEMEKAPKFGTEIHSELESFFMTGMCKKKYIKICEKVYLKIREEIGDRFWLCEESFYNPIGYGGKIDLNTDDIVIDFKTKNTDDPDKMIKTPEYAMQLAAYQMGLVMPEAKCYNVYISSINLNILKIVEYTEKELEVAWTQFKCLLKLWQTLNNVVPEVEYEI